jgi:hypothetical protein
LEKGKGRFLAENVAAIIQRISDTPHYLHDVSLPGGVLSLNDL